MTTIQPVIYRFWQGSVIALFPDTPGDSSPATCSSYQHSGQHGAVDARGILDNSRAATPEEYESLHNELKGIYEADGDVTLKIYKRMQYNHVRDRMKALERISG